MNILTLNEGECANLLHYLRRADEMLNTDTDPQFTRRAQAYIAVRSALQIVERCGKRDIGERITMTNEQIARICHEVNRGYCASLGDDSQLPWEEAPEWQRESAIKGVAFTLANPNAKPSDSHDSWLAEKVAAGWVWGPNKDPDAKPPTHPCICPYEDLPQIQRAKDFLFQAVVRSLASADRAGS